MKVRGIFKAFWQDLKTKAQENFLAVRFAHLDYSSQIGQYPFQPRKLSCFSSQALYFAVANLLREEKRIRKRKCVLVSNKEPPELRVFAIKMVKWKNDGGKKKALNTKLSTIDF